jgi:SAM-dependent methyltransferase
VVEVGCGQRPIAGALGIDVDGGDVRARGEALPLADGCVDRVVAHLALDVIEDCDAVMREIARVLARDGEVAAIVGGGPVADAGDDDGYAALATRLARDGGAAGRGDRRVRDEAAWRAWWPGHRVTWTRLEARITGAELVLTLARLARVDAAVVRDAVAARDHARVVTWLVRVTP